MLTSEPCTTLKMNDETHPWSKVGLKMLSIAYRMFGPEVLFSFLRIRWLPKRPQSSMVVNGR